MVVGALTHVPPKTLLERPLPPNLRTVPACRACNAGWSKDEEYLAVVLAHVGHQPHLTEKVEPGGVVDRALSTAPGFDQHIENSLSPGEDGRIWLQVDLGRIDRIATKVAYGLYCLQYGMGPPLKEFSTCWLSGPEQEIPMPFIAAQHFWPGIRRKRWVTVQAGVFRFLFARGWMTTDPPLYCFLDFHQTILAAVSCPSAVRRRQPYKRLAAKPWSKKR